LHIKFPSIWITQFYHKQTNQLNVMHDLHNWL